MQLKEITSIFEEFAPLTLQESYDNSGLIIGSPEQEITGILLTIDVTEEVVDEAIDKNANLIIAHHPFIFSGLKKITGNSYIERTAIKAIKHNVAIYAAHTNIDAVHNGVNKKIAEKLNMTNCKILKPLHGMLYKLVSYVPVSHVDIIREALFKAGAGCIGDYDSCSFSIQGKGSFRGNELTNPFVGEKEKLHFEDEIRFETIFPKHLQDKIIKSLLEVHPYEEVAYDIYPLENIFDKAGAGIIGQLEHPAKELAFLEKIKKIFNTKCIRYTSLISKPIEKVAVCGGSGSFLLDDAIKQGADIFITADFKYHQFFQPEKKIIIADIGHYESEQFTKEIFYEILTKKFSTFAVYFSGINTNPIKYL
jgi:dinuclear metal center YbgI/SA1388 family protein